MRGHVIPKKQLKTHEADKNNYVLCIYCKAYYKRLSLSRHMNTCFAKTLSDVKHQRPLSDSLVYSATLRDYGQLLNSLDVKEKIFSKMWPDILTSTAASDVLIFLWGEDLLKKCKTTRSLYHISAKLRRCSRFLLEMQKIDSYDSMLSTLKPQHFDNIVHAAKQMSRYSSESRSFGAPSTALQFGTHLKKLAELALKLIYRKKIPLPIADVEKCATELNRFIVVVESHWTTELGSLALKDLHEKAGKKPKLLPFTEDIRKLKNDTEQQAEESYEELKLSRSESAYKTLVETTLVLSILHNRKRVGDIQYLDLNTYSQQISLDNAEGTVQTEMAASLTENEKILTQHYKIITTIGKGSKRVTFLIPKHMQNYFAMIYKLRTSTAWFPADNVYLFTLPHSTRWLNGCTVINKYAIKCGAKKPELLTSSRLRKHIATVTDPST